MRKWGPLNDKGAMKSSREEPYTQRKSQRLGRHSGRRDRQESDFIGFLDDSILGFEFSIIRTFGRL